MVVVSVYAFVPSRLLDMTQSKGDMKKSGTEKSRIPKLDCHLNTGYILEYR
jgi:hypothetical protein